MSAEQFRTYTDHLQNPDKHADLNDLIGKAVRIVGVTSRFGFVTKGEDSNIRHLNLVPTRRLGEPPAQEYFRGHFNGVDERGKLLVQINEVGSFFEFPIQHITHLAIGETEDEENRT
jgi:hypothetical protein